MVFVKTYITQLLKYKVKNSLLYAHVRIGILKKPIRIWFFREPGFLNFGDELTTDIIERLFSKKCELVSIEDADLYGVGSIIEVIDNKKNNKKSYIWGSGLIRDGGSIVNDKLIFKAVRGRNTLSRIRSNGRVAIGDPGLLSNLIYTEPIVRTSKIGIIPHYVDEESGFLLEAKNRPDAYTVISVRSTPEEVVRQITQCRLILSSSLHGLIVADSFSIPNAHIQLSDKLVGGDYKFEDYYSATGRVHKKISSDDLYDEIKIDKIIANYQPVGNLKEIQSSLIKSFPFK